MKTLKLLLLYCIVCFLPTTGQTDTLEVYLRSGLKNNLALQQKQVSYKQSLYALKEARRMFYPAISIDARYSIAEGGRVFEFPAGQLLNPVYSTLNALTASSAFPQIEDEEFAFLRPREHETKIQVIQPLFNMGLHYNYKIKNELAHAQQVDVDLYERYLVAEIKKAYFNYLQSLQIMELATDTRELLEENHRVSKKLFENQKVTSDAIYRSQAELSKSEQMIAEAQKNREVAMAYFNFLLNRPLGSPIYNPLEPPESVIITDLEGAGDMAIEKREELDLLDHYLLASEYSLKIKRSQNHPMLLAALDYGYQGTKYRFTANDDFMIASFVLRWDIFSGFQNMARIKQAAIETELVKQQIEEAEQQIRLEVTNAFYDLKAAAKTVRTAENECIYAQKAINRIITRYDLQIKLAEFERTTASFDFALLD